MKICFIIYPWEEVDPVQDSTLKMIYEVALRGHEVAIAHPPDLRFKDSLTFGLCKTISSESDSPISIPEFYKFMRFEEEIKSLGEFDAIFLRDNPPLDPLVLNFLESINDSVFTISSNGGLRITN